MKRHLSVFELAARGAVYKTLLVSLTAAAAIFALLCAGLDGIDNLAGVLADDVHPDESANGLPGALIANMVYSAGILLLFILLSRSWAPKKGVNPTIPSAACAFRSARPLISRRAYTPSASSFTWLLRWRPIWAFPAYFFLTPRALRQRRADAALRSLQIAAAAHRCCRWRTGTSGFSRRRPALWAAWAAWRSPSGSGARVPRA